MLGSDRVVYRMVLGSTALTSVPHYWRFTYFDVDDTTWLDFWDCYCAYNAGADSIVLFTPEGAISLIGGSGVIPNPEDSRALNLTYQLIINKWWLSTRYKWHHVYFDISRLRNSVWFCAFSRVSSHQAAILITKSKNVKYYLNCASGELLLRLGLCLMTASAIIY